MAEQGVKEPRSLTDLLPLHLLDGAQQGAGKGEIFSWQ